MTDERRPPNDDSEHDAWLREALRHAPDSSAAPPLAVSDAILSQARAAATASMPRPTTSRRAPTRATAPSAVAAWWAWLARPPVAAAFASVMVATLVGLMWWDRPMDEALPYAAPSAPAPAAGRIEATPAPAAARSQTPPIADAARVDAASADSTRPVVTPPAAPAKLARSPAPEPRVKERSEARAAKSDAPLPFPSADKPAEVRAEAERNATDELKKQTAPPATMAPATSAMTAAPAPAAAPLAGRARLAASPPPTSTRDVQEKAQDAAAQGGAATGAVAKSAVAEGPAGNARPSARPAAGQQSTAPPAPEAKDEPTRQLAAAGVARKAEANAFASAQPPVVRSENAAADRREAAPAERPLANLLAALSGDGVRWTRATPSGGNAPVDEALLRWLAELDATAAGGWRPLADRGSTLDAALAFGADATGVRLLFDGRVTALVRIDAGVATLESRRAGAQGSWQAPLNAAAATRLRASLPRLP
ncbi:MAG: hypothetical protein ABJA61_09290 [Caldimonas sp.]